MDNPPLFPYAVPHATSSDLVWRGVVVHHRQDNPEIPSAASPQFVMIRKMCSLGLQLERPAKKERCNHYLTNNTVLYGHLDAHTVGF